MYPNNSIGATPKKIWCNSLVCLCVLLLLSLLRNHGQSFSCVSWEEERSREGKNQSNQLVSSSSFFSFFFFFLGSPPEKPHYLDLPPSRHTHMHSYVILHTHTYTIELIGLVLDGERVCGFVGQKKKKEKKIEANAKQLASLPPPHSLSMAARESESINFTNHPLSLGLYIYILILYLACKREI